MNEDIRTVSQLDSISGNESFRSKSSKTPKLIYCGDGVVEEYSSDEEDAANEELKKKEAQKLQQPPVDPVSIYFETKLI